MCCSVAAFWCEGEASMFLQNTGTHLPDITRQNAVWIFSAVGYFRSSTYDSPLDIKRHLACSQISEVKAMAVVIIFFVSLTLGIS